MLFQTQQISDCVNYKFSVNLNIFPNSFSLQRGKTQGKFFLGYSDCVETLVIWCQTAVSSTDIANVVTYAE